MLHEDIHQELVLKEIEIGELQLENEVLEHKVSKLEEENQNLKPTSETCAVTIHCTSLHKKMCHCYLCRDGC